ncbi:MULTISPECIES: helix-turn-helix transcriptional regulator [Pseudomonas]|uniref:LuxR family transcriptional regulator n=1 Tax=Pseudomonas chlororaphis TaxID=587753 RepID=A0AAX3FNE6_9PSED|nr:MULTISPECIES: helix-turn-helix transcriptional regulator [Pseudomonas]AZC37768.1 Transcriptional regulator, LuxR family [Pseudomonas chlororaphis subsp. piscium]AZC44316.1 Transcriptional regulator, LuxR family [Pseudomonas chlororaphis subsp. piscium]AZC76252.1 Transcriptional regulator, LuxR family [Pseudomonas chlororaphis subsp. piscium]AZC96061.1 Transcriptional regulator, LuxR family [Pseudomonas chlororaphis subsp. piscium]PMY44855.1 LuxR family transcriptional regulator [Pseudomonas
MALNQILSLQEVVNWNMVLASLFDRQLENGLPGLLSDAMKQFIEHDTFILKAYDHGSDLPIIISHDIPAHRHYQYFEIYFASAYKDDPLLDKLRYDGTGSVIQINASTCSLKNSAYYRTYYEDLHLHDEIDILLPVAPRQSLVLSIGRRGGVAHEDELATLSSVYPLIECLLKNFWKQRSVKQDAHLMPHSIETRLARFGEELLTVREREITRWMLQGKCTKEIARLLEISAQTVKVHRRNIYAKLGVNTELQLCSRFAATVLPSPYEGNSKHVAQWSGR